MRRSVNGLPGFTVLELLLALAVTITATGIALPLVTAGLNSVRVATASHYVSTRLASARMEAIKRGRAVALKFERDDIGYTFGLWMDGNGNGVRTADIRSGRDIALGVPERLEDRFASVTFLIEEDVRDVDGGSVIVTGDPVRVGASDILTFTPLGTATAGTLYIAGPGRNQYALRILGTTARTRLLRYDFALRTWIER